MAKSESEIEAGRYAINIVRIICFLIGDFTIGLGVQKSFGDGPALMVAGGLIVIVVGVTAFLAYLEPTK